MSPRPDTATPRRPGVARPLLTTLAPVDPAARPVVAVHPGALPATAWQPVAARLPEDHALHLCDLGNVPEYFAAALVPTLSVIGVQELAHRCLGELTAAGLTDRPFTLAGWSFGGVVAYEIAARLDAQGLGDRVEDLVVLDSIAPVPAFQRPDELLRPDMLLTWFAMYLGAKRGRRLTLEPTALDGLGEEEGLAVLLTAAVEQGVLQEGTEPAGLRKLYTAFHTGLVRNNRCTAGYLPAPLDRTVTVVKPERSLLPDSPDLGWSGLSGRPLRQLAVPGDHYTMLHEPETADALAALLATGSRTG
ncbi:thioesterase domain-containing protein [Streptomyces sp. TLI_185]|uniref:thioesterase domain-containing protein n=1 Tax=Streptomyces sp. TLI_185 TaxID=2485151 RepID=UPI000F4E8581|nr:thioesterase domain-containing protein [Streptomyces sp. TLI_185]RPF32266.1 thioesterase domain-containing protein [Streptomyces sp. TLI_185]